MIIAWIRLCRHQNRSVRPLCRFACDGSAKLRKASRTEVPNLSFGLWEGDLAYAIQHLGMRITVIGVRRGNSFSYQSCFPSRSMLGADATLPFTHSRLRIMSVLFGRIPKSLCPIVRENGS